MSDEQALLAAIRANPDEDTPRLVYADWLDEHGHAKRAAYIRDEVERYRCEHADTTAAAFGAFLDEIGERADERVDWSALDPEFDRFSKAAARKLPTAGRPTPKSEKLPKVRGVKFERIERGFHSSVTVSNADAFLKNADAIFRAAPVTSISFGRLGAEEARSFVAAGHLARLRRVGLGSSVGSEAVRALGNHPDAAGVQELGVELWDETPERLEAVTAGKHWTGVTRLAFDGFDFDYEGQRPAAALVRAPQFKSLRAICAGDTDLGDPFCRAVATAGLTELRHLNLGGCLLTESGAGALASSKALTNLRYLDICGNSVGAEAAAALITTAKFPHLTALLLDECPDAKGLSQPGRGPTLRGLRLAWEKLSARKASALAACPALRGLWYLELWWCDQTDETLKALARHAKFEQLTVLALRDQAISERGVAALAGCAALSSLQDLRLETKALGPTCARALARSPHLQRLKRIRASGRGLSILRDHFGKKVVS
jgi:uncharacterized protein (TIGR02996 family)